MTASCEFGYFRGCILWLLGDEHTTYILRLTRHKDPIDLFHTKEPVRIQLLVVVLVKMTGP